MMSNKQHLGNKAPDEDQSVEKTQLFLESLRLQRELISQVKIGYFRGMPRTITLVRGIWDIGLQSFILKRLKSIPRARRVADVAVILPTINRPALLKRALISVAVQRVLPRQLVIVNDGTEFGNYQIEEIRTLMPEQVELMIVHAGGIGGPAARNLGLAKVSTPIVTYLDDDNLMFVGWIKNVAKYSHRSDVSLIYGAQSRQDTPSHYVGRKHSVEALKTRNYIDTGMIAHFTGIGRWDSQIKRFGDWDFVLGVALDEANVVRFVPRFASCYLDDAPKRASAQNNSAEWEMLIKSKHGIVSDPQYF